MPHNERVKRYGLQGQGQVRFINFLNLFRPGVFNFYLKQLVLLAKYRNNLTLKSFSLTLEKSCAIQIDDGAKINFGKRICIRKGVDIEAHDDSIINVGDNFFINKNSSIVSRYGIDIGSNCMIGDHALICDHNHCFSDRNLPFNLQGYTGGKIKIGNNVWLGTKVFVGPGAEIGNNVVIGAHTIVTKSIPSNSLVYGRTELVIKPLENCDTIPAC